jgi:hypothetical protein
VATHTNVLAWSAVRARFEAVPEQIVWLLALVITGRAMLVKFTVLLVPAHAPLLMVQRRVAVVPAGTPVTVEVRDVGVVMVAVPDTSVHRPEPVVGALPANVKLPVAQSDWLGPALDTGAGVVFTTIVFVASTPPQLPCAMSVRVMGDAELLAAVNVAKSGVLPPLLLNVPLGADHMAPVAVPPNVPPNGADVPLWQIAAIAGPAFTVHWA